MFWRQFEIFEKYYSKKKTSQIRLSRITNYSTGKTIFNSMIKRFFKFFLIKSIFAKDNYNFRQSKFPIFLLQAFYFFNFDLPQKFIFHHFSRFRRFPTVFWYLKNPGSAPFFTINFSKFSSKVIKTCREERNFAKSKVQYSWKKVSKNLRWKEKSFERIRMDFSLRLGMQGHRDDRFHKSLWEMQFYQEILVDREISQGYKKL